MTYAVLFPGQGSQFVGMGADLFDLRPDLLGETADEVLGWSLRSLCLDGPEDALTRTEHAQPALFAVSYAVWTRFRDAVGVDPVTAAGHSLGEYTALVAAGSLDYATALSVVAERGRAMADAADREASGMAALLGVDADDAEEAASARRSEGGRLWVANLNAPGQVVVAGGEDDLAWLAANASGYGVRRVIPLKVAGAFHSPFMAPAADRLRAALSGVAIRQPVFPVWSNTTARPHTAEGLADMLVDQVVSPVRFSEILEGIAASGVKTFVHVGPGDVTAGMARKTVPGAEIVVVSSSDDVEAAADSIVSM